MKHFCLIIGLIFLTACGSNKPLATVSQLDIQDYLGKWYEIERFPHSFEKDLQCVTATYTLKDDGDINVLNQGYDGKKWKDVEGKAWVPDANKPGELKVEFFWPFAGDYYIIDTNPEQYALVGAPGRDYLWILSREKSLPPATIKDLKEKAQKLGFDISKLSTVSHDCP